VLQQIRGGLFLKRKRGSGIKTSSVPKNRADCHLVPLSRIISKALGIET
jgi:hypothetical protein